MRLAWPLVLLAACTPAPSAVPVPAASTSAAASTLAAVAPVDAGVPSCRFDTDPFAPASLRERVTFLASDLLAGRTPGSDGDRATRAHIEARFHCLGLGPGGPDGGFQQPFVDAGRDTANVIAVLPGADDTLGQEIVVVGAHHDHLGVAAGKLYPGANDNASGVAALLAVAQSLAERDTPPRRTVVFVAFGAEESGLTGSAHFVAHAPAALPMESVVYMINLDMVGSHGDAGRVYALGGFRGLPARQQIAALADRHATLRIRFGAAGRGSDHQPFCDLGIPYLFFWTPDARCYHRPCDQADRLDYARMSEIAALAAELALGLADSPEDLAASRQRHGCGAR